MLARLTAALAAIHLTAAGLVVAAVWQAQAVGPVLGGVALAYVWGLQHGFAADHIAAIDDSTRLLVARGRPAAGSAGLAFATGHGITITAATAVLITTTRGRVPPALEAAALGFVVCFLTVICVANGRLLCRSIRGDDVGPARGLLARLGGELLQARVGRSRHLIVVGMAFGVASIAEVFVLVVASQHGVGAPALVPVALAVTFSAGLALVDTADSVVMARAYRWAAGDAERRRFANVTATSLTIAVSALVVTILAASIAVETTGVRARGPLSMLADLSRRFEFVGAGAVIMFALWWAVAGLVWRLRKRVPSPDRPG